jgi:hypothetical protein
MKKLIIMMTIGFALIMTNCKGTDMLVAITPGISVWLPDNYKIRSINISSTDTTYEATFNHDDLKLYKTNIKGADTLSMNKKKEIFQKNVDRFVQTFDVKNVTVSDKMVGSIMQKDFSFRYTRHDSIFNFYCRFLVEKENFLALCYRTFNPADQSSVKTRERFFNFTLIK